VALRPDLSDSLPFRICKTLLHTKIYDGSGLLSNPEPKFFSVFNILHPILPGEKDKSHEKWEFFKKRGQHLIRKRAAFLT